MKMNLRTICCTEKPIKRTTPMDHFKKCPNCGDKNLIRLDPDVLCSSCDWDSLAWDVSRGAMNNLEQAAREIFKTGPVLVAKQKTTDRSTDVENESDDISTEEKQGA